MFRHNRFMKYSLRMVTKYRPIIVDSLRNKKYLHSNVITDHKKNSQKHIDPIVKYMALTSIGGGLGGTLFGCALASKDTSESFMENICTGTGCACLFGVIGYYSTPFVLPFVVVASIPATFMYFTRRLKKK